MASGARAGHKISRTNSTGNYDLVKPHLSALVPLQAMEVQVKEDLHSIFLRSRDEHSGTLASQVRFGLNPGAIFGLSWLLVVSLH